MNNIFKYGFFILVIAIILIVVFKGEGDGNKLYVQELENKIERLNDVNSLLEAKNSQIITDIGLKMDSIAVLESEVAEIENKRIAAIKYYEKRINNIDKFNVIQLDSSFTTRYTR